jgi:hypothetical protein
LSVAIGSPPAAPQVEKEKLHVIAAVVIGTGGFTPVSPGAFSLVTYRRDLGLKTAGCRFLLMTLS